MSKVLYVCSRNKMRDTSIKEKLGRICVNLVPDNIEPDPKKHTVFVTDNIAYAICMDKGAFDTNELSLLAGTLFEEDSINWSEPRGSYPDGNYALFRVNQDEVEIVSDCAATRTVWYYHDDELFVASTSQLAIVMYLESFSFNDATIPWLLSTGSLGPNLSWDKRFRRLQPDSSLLLDRKDWHISVQSNQAFFREVKRQPEEHQKQLTDAIGQTIASISAIDFKHWVLPLSGGYDSRGILCFIKKIIGIPDGLKAVTWGLEESVHEEGNDAKVAKDLARTIGVPHDFYHTDISSEPIEAIIERFLFCSEGRIDHIAGYMDGMDIWKRFHDENITGVIRGDEGFGWVPVSSEMTVRTSVGCGLCSDFKNLTHIIDEFKLPAQELPNDLQKRDEETLDSWRDRLYHSYRLPTILSALSDIKFSYVDQINPLLSRTVINYVRSVPDNLRTDKLLFRRIVESISPNVPFATKGANASPVEILKNKKVYDLLKFEINSRYSADLLGRDFIEFINRGMESEKANSGKKKRSIKSLISSMLPKSIKNIMRDTVAKPTVHGNILAFRVFIIVKMHKKLTEYSTKRSS